MTGALIFMESQTKFQNRTQISKFMFKILTSSVTIAVISCGQGQREGGAGGTMIPGSMDFRGPSWGPLALGGPVEGPWPSEDPSK